MTEIDSWNERPLLKRRRIMKTIGKQNNVNISMPHLDTILSRIDENENDNDNASLCQLKLKQLKRYV